MVLGDLATELKYQEMYRKINEVPDKKTVNEHLKLLLESQTPPSMHVKFNGNEYNWIRPEYNNFRVDQ